MLESRLNEEPNSLRQEIMNEDLGFGPQFRNSTLEIEPSKALINEELREAKLLRRAREHAQLLKKPHRQPDPSAGCL